MTAPEQPVIEVSIEHPRRLSDITKWAALAEALDFPATAVVALTSIGTPTLSVRAYIAQVEAPELES